MKYLSLIGVVLWIGCAASLPRGANQTSGSSERALVAAVSNWRGAGLPWTETCEQEYGRVRVIMAYPNEFSELCLDRPSSAGGRLYACSTSQLARAWPWSFVDRTKVPLLIVSALQPFDHRQGLVVHEALHWLGSCTGRGIDYEHQDNYVWQALLSGTIDQLRRQNHYFAQRARALHLSRR